MNNLQRTSLVKRLIRTQAFTLFILLVAMVLIFTVLAVLKGARFFTTKTFIGILQDIAVPGFLAIGRRLRSKHRLLRSVCAVGHHHLHRHQLVGAALVCGRPHRARLCRGHRAV